MDTDLKAPFQICRKAIKGMLERERGVILNIGSVASLRGLHGPSYNAAKAGLIGKTMSIAVAYGRRGIRCNIINSQVASNSTQNLASARAESFTRTGGNCSRVSRRGCR